MSYLSILNLNLFKIEEIDENTVLLMLEKLDTTKAAGIHSLGPRSLKLAAPMIYKPLTLVINKSINTGKFPD